MQGITIWFLLTLFGVGFGRSLLRSAPQMCPIDDGNLLEVKLFVKDGNKCYTLCELNADCQYFRLVNPIYQTQ